MKKTKLFAGIISAAMLASMLPVGVMAETIDSVYDYTFEDGAVPSEFNMDSAITDWSADVVEEDGNKVLKYTFTKPEDDANLTSDKYLINLATGAKVTDKTAYWEYSFKYKMSNLKADFSQFMFVECGFGQRQINELSYSGKTEQIKYKVRSGESQYTNIEDQWVSVKIHMKSGEPGAARVSQTYVKDGSTVTETVLMGEKMPSCKYAPNVGLYLKVTSNADMADGECLYLDDISMKEVTVDNLAHLTFNTNGGNEIASMALFSTTYALPIPVREEYYFDGWYADETLEIPYTFYYALPDAGCTLYAKWLEAYTITFNTGDGGPAVEPLPVAKEIGVAKKLPFPEKSGYNFKGWYVDEALQTPFNIYNEVTANTTLYAKWEEKGDVLLNIDFDSTAYPDGLDVPAQTLPFDTWKTGLETDSETGNTSLMYHRKQNASAVKGENYMIFQYNFAPELNKDGSSTYEFSYRFNPDSADNTYMPGAAFQLKLGNYEIFNPFKGYPTLKSLVTIKFGNNETTGWVTVKVKFNPGTGAYSYRCIGTKKADGEEVVIDSGDLQINNYDAANVSTLSLLTKELNDKGALTKDQYLYLDDIKLSKLKQYTVTFVTGTDDELEPKTTADGYITLPQIVKDGYAIDGWYEDPEFTIPFDANNVTKDVTIYAKWDKCYTITFETNGGKTIDSITTTGEFEMPSNPTKPGYTFEGWYTDSEFTYMYTYARLTQDLTIYAKWSPYLAKADFETPYYYSGFDIAESVAAKGYWHNRRVTDSETGNTYMEYYRTPDDAPGQFQDNIFNVTGDLTCDAGALYEIGVKYDPNDCGAYFNTGISLRFNGQYGRKYEVAKLGGYPSLRKSVTINGVKTTGFISMRAILDPATGKGTTIYRGTSAVDGSLLEQKVEFDFSAMNDNYAKITTDEARIKEISGFSVSTGTCYGETQDEKKNDSFLVDDFYVKSVQISTVTFDSMGGSEVASARTDETGYVEMPEPPQKDGFVFTGWYEDTDFTIPFDNGLVQKDITVYARWQTNPTVERISPANGETGVSLNPEIKIYWDSEMDSSSINEDSVIISAGDVTLDISEYTVDNSLVNGKTLTRVVFNHSLSMNKTYTIRITTDAANFAGGMTEEYVSTFETKKIALKVEAAEVQDSEGNPVTGLGSNAGKQITVRLQIKNNLSEDKVYTPVFFIMSENKLKTCNVGEEKTASVTEENSEVFNLSVPTDAQDSDELNLMIVDGMNTISPLAVKTKLN